MLWHNISLFYLNRLLKLLSYPLITISNNLSHKICCESIVDIIFFLSITIFFSTKKKNKKFTYFQNSIHTHLFHLAHIAIFFFFLSRNNNRLYLYIITLYNEKEKRRVFFYQTMTYFFSFTALARTRTT